MKTLDKYTSLWVWSFCHCTGENPRATGGNRAEAVGAEACTYIEVSGSVKAVLIGHHTERRREEEGKETAQGSGGGRQKRNKNRGVMRHRVADARNNR